MLALTFAVNSTSCCFYVGDKRRSKGGNAEAEADKTWKTNQMPKIIVAMISAGSSTCGAEAEPAAEDDEEAETEAGIVSGGNNCSQFADRCPEALGTVPANCVPRFSRMMGPLPRFF